MLILNLLNVHPLDLSTRSLSSTTCTKQNKNFPKHHLKENLDNTLKKIYLKTTKQRYLFVMNKLKTVHIHSWKILTYCFIIKRIFKNKNLK